MSETDNSSLPSVLDAKSRWEQLSNDSSSNTSNNSPSAGGRSASPNATATRPQPQRSANSYPATSTTSPSEPPPRSPSLTLDSHFPNESAPNLTSASTTLKPKPAVAPKPARLSASLQSLSLGDDKEHQQQHHAPEITVTNDHQGQGGEHHRSTSSSSTTNMAPPPVPPPRPDHQGQGEELQRSTSSNMAPPPVPPPRPVTPTMPSSQRPQQKPTPPKPRSPVPPPPRNQHAISPSPRLDRTESESGNGLSVPKLPTRRVVTPPESNAHDYFHPQKSPKPPPPPPRRCVSTSTATSTPTGSILPMADLSSNNTSTEDLLAPQLPPRPPSRSISPVSHVQQSSQPAQFEPQPNHVQEQNVDQPKPLDLKESQLLQPEEIGYGATSGEESDADSGEQQQPSQGYPDSSQANRRAPVFEGVLDSITVRGEVRATAAFGRYACVSGIATRVFDLHTGECVWTMDHGEVKMTAVEFKLMGDANDGKILWLGTKEGQIWEVSTDQSGPLQKRANCHLTPIVLIYKNGSEMWTLSEDGKLCVWPCDLTQSPKTYRATPNFKAFTPVDNQLWVGRNRQTNIYQPALHDTQFQLTHRPIPAFTNAGGRQAGEFSCAGRLPSMPDSVLFGHEDGTVTIYSIPQMAAIESIKVSISRICALRGVGHYLWLGLKNGNVMVCDVNHKQWQVLKEWKAHDGPVNRIYCDDMSLQAGMLPVVTSSTDMVVKIWDGLLKRDWIEMDMYQHDEEYSTFRDINVQVVTWNAGAAKPTDLEQNRVDSSFLKTLLLEQGQQPDLLVFGFQELVELDNKSVTAKSMMFSKRKKRDKEVSVAAHISHQYKDWQDRLYWAVNEAFDERYRLVHSNNMVGLFTCVLLKESMGQSLQGVRSSVVKTGLGGLHGNKGGLAVRMMLDNSSLCFVNCHLAAGQSGSLQRNKDIESILDTDLTDESVNSEFTGKGIFVNGGDGTRILDHEICFFAGDMNYRINTQRPVAMKLLQEEQYEKLLEMDQLYIQVKKSAGMRLRAFQEMHINFPPTYKFDVGTDNYDTSEKKRVPAWCDRIFYRGGKRITPLKYGSHVCRVSDHRPVSGFYRVQIKTIDNMKRNETYKQSLNRWNTFLEQAVSAASQSYG